MLSISYEIILLNTAAILVLTNKCKNLKQGIEIAEKNKEAISAQLQQQTSALAPQLDNIEKQLYDTNKSIANKKGERGKDLINEKYNLTNSFNLYKNLFTRLLEEEYK